MLRRLAIALTALLAATGAVVVAGYLFIFAAGTDRAAAAVPADASAYLTVYLQPTTGQQLNLAAMLGQVRDAGCRVLDVEVRSPSLHSVFIHLTGRELRE